MVCSISRVGLGGLVGLGPQKVHWAIQISLIEKEKLFWYCYEWMTWLPSPWAWLPSPLLGIIALFVMMAFNIILIPLQPSWLLQDAIPLCIAIYMCILFVNGTQKLNTEIARESNYILSFLDLVSLFISFNLQQIHQRWECKAKRMEHPPSK